MSRSRGATISRWNFNRLDVTSGMDSEFFQARDVSQAAQSWSLGCLNLISSDRSSRLLCQPFDRRNSQNLWARRVLARSRYQRISFAIICTLLSTSFFSGRESLLRLFQRSCSNSSACSHWICLWYSAFDFLVPNLVRVRHRQELAPGEMDWVASIHIEASIHLVPERECAFNPVGG